MTFNDLPPHSDDLPLTDPILRADIVDLIVRLRDRESGCLALILLDDEDRCAAPVVITDMGPPTIHTVNEACDMILGHIPTAGLVVVLGRGGRSQPTDADRACHQVVLDVCRERGIRLLGTYLATTDDHVLELPTPEERLAS